MYMYECYVICCDELGLEDCSMNLSDLFSVAYSNKIGRPGLEEGCLEVVDT